MRHPWWLSSKASTCNAGDTADTGLILRWERSPGGGHGNPLQYSRLENPMDRGTWQAAVYRVSQSLTQLKQLSTHTISLSIMSTSFIHIVAHIQISFLKLNTLCVSITFCFSTHLLMDILVVSTSWLS